MSTDNNNTNQNTEQTEEVSCAQEMDSLRRELKLAQDKALYLAADFDNVRKRLEKDKYTGIDNAYKVVLLDVLGVVDNFERAFAEMQQKPELEAYLQGFTLIYKALQKMLNQYQVHEITDVTAFNPEIHEAIMHVTDSDKPSGHIVDVFEKGYMYKGQLLRPAKVSVQA
jgi:molecular chaperone GrpE